MALGIEDIRKVCRFCLRRESLTPLSASMSSTFSVEDVIRYTGIQILENEETAHYSVCLECCVVIKNSVFFRRTCLKNDATFKKLVVVLSAQTKLVSTTSAVHTIGSSEIGSDSPRSTSGNQYAQSLADDGDIVSLDDDDDDAHFRPESDLQTEHSKVNLVNHNDSNGFLSLPPDKQGENVTKEDDVGNAETTFAFSDDDSDYSMPSLYEEEMRKSLIEQSKEDNASSTGASNEQPSPKQETTERGLCPFCGGLYVDMYGHLLRGHYATKTFKCSQCPKAFRDRFDLKRHMNTWHEKRIILTCEHCGKGFTNHGSHYYHMKNSHGESDVYECAICQRKFKSIDGYKKHKKEHSLTSYPCPHCEKLFKTTLTLEKHNRRYHASAS